MVVRPYAPGVNKFLGVNTQYSFACTHTHTQQHRLNMAVAETLPDHLISMILRDADLDIETRRALRLRPGSVKRVMAAAAYSALSDVLDARSKMWVEFLRTGRTPLGKCRSPLLAQEVQGRKQMSYVTMYVRALGNGPVVMRVEKLVVLLDGSEAFVSGSLFCDVHSAAVLFYTTAAAPPAWAIGLGGLP